ncbi:MAG TPA: hypothetical protein VKY73_18575 [Polyangiaceae bacterium]|nr:hypothetical protein [Polyangiaceae bacterium]
MQRSFFLRHASGIRAPADPVGSDCILDPDTDAPLLTGGVLG